MKKTLNLIEVLDNLNRMPRTGGVLFAGMRPEMGDSLAEHSYKVVWLTMLFVARLRKESPERYNEIRKDILYEHAISHDWAETVLFDMPYGSPSYQSYWKDIDIRDQAEKAQEGVFRTMELHVAEDITLTLDREPLTPVEKSIFKAADIVALLVEILNWKYLGYKYDWFDFMWANTLKRLKSVATENLPELSELANDLADAYQKGSKDPRAFSYVVNQAGRVALGKLAASHALLARTHDLVSTGPHYYNCASGFLFHLRSQEQDRPLKVLILSNFRVLPKRVIENILQQGTVILTQTDNHYSQLSLDEEQYNQITEKVLF